MNIPVVYEDEWLLAVDKPAGLLVISTPKNERRTLTGLLNEDLKERRLSYRLHPCHRLDRATSGLILYAKGKSVQKKMMEQFKQRKVRKVYVAFLQGILLGNQGQIKAPIENSPALTKYRVIRREKNFSAIEAIPLTGRTNQLRLHFKAIGHPIVGEDRFAFRKDFALRAKRLCLHAKSLEFTHPVSGKNISLDTRLPKELEEFLRIHT